MCFREMVQMDSWTMVMMIAFGVFCVVGVAIEILWNWRQDSKYAAEEQEPEESSVAESGENAAAPNSKQQKSPEVPEGPTGGASDPLPSKQQTHGHEPADA